MRVACPRLTERPCKERKRRDKGGNNRLFYKGCTRYVPKSKKGKLIMSINLKNKQEIIDTMMKLAYIQEELAKEDK